MRGCSLVLISGTGVDTPGGEQQLVDWFSRKQPHVCRSTCAAGLPAALDGVDQTPMGQSFLTWEAFGTRLPDAFHTTTSVGRA